MGAHQTAQNGTLTTNEMLGARTVRPVGGQESTQDIEKDILFGHEDIKHSTRTVRVADGQTIIQHTEKFVKGPPWRRSSTLISEN